MQGLAEESQAWNHSGAIKTKQTKDKLQSRKPAGSVPPVSHFIKQSFHGTVRKSALVHYDICPHITRNPLTRQADKELSLIYNLEEELQGEGRFQTSTHSHQAAAQCDRRLLLKGIMPGVVKLKQEKCVLFTFSNRFSRVFFFQMFKQWRPKQPWALFTAITAQKCWQLCPAHHPVMHLWTHGLLRSLWCYFFSFLTKSHPTWCEKPVNDLCPYLFLRFSNQVKQSKTRIAFKKRENYLNFLGKCKWHTAM